MESEQFPLLLEFLRLSKVDFLGAFPEAEKYVIDGDFNLSFALARICLDEVDRASYKLFAFE